jgi:hypothetical protein
MRSEVRAYMSAPPVVRLNYTRTHHSARYLHRTVHSRVPHRHSALRRRLARRTTTHSESGLGAPLLSGPSAIAKLRGDSQERHKWRCFGGRSPETGETIPQR